MSENLWTEVAKNDKKDWITNVKEQNLYILTLKAKYIYLTLIISAGLKFISWMRFK